MLYSKPEIVPLDTALKAVQSNNKHGAVPDAVPPTNRPSIAAYEADE
jgi:hypothetical protein